MLAGEAVVAIWNGITEAGRAEFYEWHLHEHMPERAAIPGFLRGRRYVALSGAPEFFTLYEARDFGVLEGPDYLARLNAPTPWTRRATAAFQDTSRTLARVVATAGPGMGGVALTVRFAADPAAGPGLAAVVRAALGPRITGAHLCAGDGGASGAPTAESAGRTDLRAPPGWFAMIEATDAAALAMALPEADVLAEGARDVVRGVYRLEYVRNPTDR